MLHALAAVLALTGQTGVWLDVPYVKQRDARGCGPAVLAMVLDYWKRPADPAEIERRLESNDRGVAAAEMERYLRDSGFRAFAFQGEWEDLRRHLERGRPLIVCLEQGGSALHYVVVAGLDWDSGHVLVNDPARRKLLRIERTAFEKAWKGRWTLLAVPAAP